MDAYQRDAYRRELETAVKETGVDGSGRPWVIFEDTVFYPEGGGQPADRGLAGGIAVVDVQKSAEGPRHFLAEPLAPSDAPCHLVLDWGRRFELMQQHTGQHLLTAVALRDFGWETTAFHLQEDSADIELDVVAPSAEQLATLEEAVVAEIRAAREVRGFWVKPEDMASLGVRSRGLPAGHQGEVRLVEIAGIDLNTCGGTHVRSTAELETLKIVGTDKMRGGTRVFFAVGSRVRRQLARQSTLIAELNKAFSSNEETLLATALGRLDQWREADRRQRQLEKAFAEACADALVAQGQTLVSWHDDDASPALLQQIARRFVAAPSAGLLLATAGGNAGAHFVVAAGPRAPESAADAGRRVAEALDARGGGNGPLFQGRATNLERRAAALAALQVEGQSSRT